MSSAQAFDEEKVATIKEQRIIDAVKKRIVLSTLKEQFEDIVYSNLSRLRIIFRQANREAISCPPEHLRRPLILTALS
jgi:hypothetical protein